MNKAQKDPGYMPLLRQIAWRDLVPMRRIDGLAECLHPLPWLAASWLLAAQALWLFALPCSFMFFLTALRLNHEAIHGHLGFGAHGHRLVMHALSAIMLGSNNAVAFNHLQHHRHNGTPQDLEGKAGRMKGWRCSLMARSSRSRCILRPGDVAGRRCDGG